MEACCSLDDDTFWQWNNPCLHVANKMFVERHSSVNDYEFNGLKVHCISGVYHPHETSSSRRIIQGLEKNLSSIGSQVLDMGTGSGVIGIFLAKTGRDVTMVDIDLQTLECAKI